ncbi:MAG TPA: glycosyltransferase family 4 protein [Steroidobacteraceae bacterium]|jgi:glycosyltransferase involved in cell wall biosynthesis
MRIAMVVPGGVDRSGEYRVIPALVAFIERLSLHNDVQVIALNQEIEPGAWELAGAQIHNIGGRHTRPRAVHAIYKMHRTLSFDVVHAIWSGSCGLVAAVAGRVLRIPSLVHVAGGELVSIPDIGYGGMQRRRGRLREAWVLRGVSTVTAASAPVIETLSQLGVAAHRVPLGVDLKSWPPRNPVRRDPARPARLIHVASLNRVKDQYTLLRALAALRRSGLRFEMDVVGDDTLDGEIQTLANQLGLSEIVRFRGFLPQRQLRPLVEAADLMVHSSRYEAGPLVTLEAAVAGVPTVGTMVGHIAEWAPDAAISVPVGDWACLAAAIRHLLEDEDLRMAIAREALKRSIQEDADFTAQRFRALYTGLL